MMVRRTRKGTVNFSFAVARKQKPSNSTINLTIDSIYPKRFVTIGFPEMLLSDEAGPLTWGNRQRLDSNLSGIEEGYGLMGFDRNLPKESFRIKMRITARGMVSVRTVNVPAESVDIDRNSMLFDTAFGGR